MATYRNLNILRIPAFLLLFLLATSKGNACNEGKIFIKGNFGLLDFTVEISKSVAQKQKGLMGRSELDARSAMLFLYKEPQKVSFWMKNTSIPLDIIFLSSSGEIRQIHHSAKPYSTKSISGGPDIIAVLEINHRIAKLKGIKTGDVVQHPFFSQFDPIWPCENVD